MDGRGTFITASILLMIVPAFLLNTAAVQTIIHCAAPAAPRTTAQHYDHRIMGRRFPDGGLLRYRKWVPQQLARWHGSQSHGFAVWVWSTVCICCPSVVKLVRSNLALDFPLFHGCWFVFSIVLLLGNQDCRLVLVLVLVHEIRIGHFSKNNSAEMKWYNHMEFVLVRKCKPLHF